MAKHAYIAVITANKSMNKFNVEVPGIMNTKSPYDTFEEAYYSCRDVLQDMCAACEYFGRDIPEQDSAHKIDTDKYMVATVIIRFNTKKSRQRIIEEIASGSDKYDSIIHPNDTTIDDVIEQFSSTLAKIIASKDDDKDE